jgi:hypothetical protein
VSEASERTILVRCGTAEGRILVGVEDRGVGIPADNLDRIFNFGFTAGRGGTASACTRAPTPPPRSAARSGATFTLDIPLLAARTS